MICTRYIPFWGRREADLGAKKSQSKSALGVISFPFIIESAQLQTLRSAAMNDPVPITSSPIKRDTSPTSEAPIALTTTFTPSSSCLDELWRAISDNWTWMRLGPTDTADCLPSGWSSHTYYSPGVCPSGWHMAYSETVIVSSSTQIVGTCCPQYMKG